MTVNHRTAIIRGACFCVLLGLPLLAMFQPGITTRERIYFFSGIGFGVVLFLSGFLLKLDWQGRTTQAEATS